MGGRGAAFFALVGPRLFCLPPEMAQRPFLTCEHRQLHHLRAGIIRPIRPRPCKHHMDLENCGDPAPDPNRPIFRTQQRIVGILSIPHSVIPNLQ